MTIRGCCGSVKIGTPANPLVVGVATGSPIFVQAMWPVLGLPRHSTAWVDGEIADLLLYGKLVEIDA